MSSLKEIALFYRKLWGGKGSLRLARTLVPAGQALASDDGIYWGMVGYISPHRHHPDFVVRIFDMQTGRYEVTNFDHTRALASPLVFSLAVANYEFYFNGYLFPVGSNDSNFVDTPGLLRPAGTYFESAINPSLLESP